MPEGARRILFGADHPGGDGALCPADRGRLTRRRGRQRMAKFRIAGISFDHMHMGDLLRLVQDHPDAEIAGIFDPDRVGDATARSRPSASRTTAFSPTSTPACRRRDPDLAILCAATADHADYTERLAAYGVPRLRRKTLRGLGRGCAPDDRGDGRGRARRWRSTGRWPGSKATSPPSG